MNYQIVIWLVGCSLAVIAQKVPNFAENRNTIVHLFEWKWSDIANECETFLQYHGFAGVQTSPPNENLIIESANRPWWERYQPLSYHLGTRSGNETELADMIRRCNNVGVRIYPDIVVNHMTAGSGIGTAGNTADRENKIYPAVPYNSDDFHVSCEINDYNDAYNVHDCELENLADLDQNLDYVQNQIVNYMNGLIDLGVAGFRIDAAKHMAPDSLKSIYSKLNKLNTEHGFLEGAKPFLFQEVIDVDGSEAVSVYDYTEYGTVTEFRYGSLLGNVFQGNDHLSNLYNWGSEWGLVQPTDALVFIDNHDNQRTGSSNILTYKNSKPYKMAIAFMLAHTYGTTRIISSYAFENKDQPPPQDADYNLISPIFNEDNSCSNGYIAEHRWRQIYQMVEFQNTVAGTDIEEWWSDDDQQIAFSRGNKGFVAFTLQTSLDQSIHTNLPEGVYCDVISGGLIDGECTGKSVVVGSDGYAQIQLDVSEEDGVLAIHVNAKQ